MYLWIEDFLSNLIFYCDKYYDFIRNIFDRTANATKNHKKLAITTDARPMYKNIVESLGHRQSLHIPFNQRFK
ncbi:MAG: hypothetical protein LBT10_04385 [Methanobrevibacter sp.]|jgi:hypothetical protein|nr:hypothetical protein [Methanobrevibacter sp.]